jgi:hypothetical protein
MSLLSPVTGPAERAFGVPSGAAVVGPDTGSDRGRPDTGSGRGRQT